MRVISVVVVTLFLATSVLLVSAPHLGKHDPCDSHGDCVSSSISYVRSNPDASLYVGDSFNIPVSVTAGQNTTDYSVSWSYPPVFEKSGDTFVVAENQTGTFSIEASVTFTGSVAVGNTTQPFTSTLMTAQSVTVIPLVISLQTRIVNVTDSQGQLLRNEDGSFYRNDSFCDTWDATFQFAPQRSDIRINVTSLTPPSLSILNYSAGPLGRTGRFCYVVRMTAAYRPANVTLAARALNWQGVSLALEEASQPFAVVRYDPQFTTYSYMEYRNSTASSSLERPWVLFVRYDGNDPGYSYAGDANTLSFNGSRTLAERAYFDNFTFTSLSYQPFSSGGVFGFHVTNGTGLLRYDWLNQRNSALLEGKGRIEKYVFDVTPSSLAPLLSEGYAYQNIIMEGCWTHEGGCYLKQNYWLVPFLWNGRVNVVSVDSNGNLIQDAPVSVTISNPSPLDQWLVGNFGHVFGSDSQALQAFEEDLYPTNQTMTFSGTGELGILLNQTSLFPPQISITAAGVTTSGNFTFVPTFVNSTITSIPNSLNGTVFYANATIPLWSYNVVQGSLAYLPVSTAIDYPSSFLELVNSSGWVAGSTTSPQIPSAFASQEYGFWPMGENLTVYVNLQGGGVDLLGVQRVGPSEYQATFNIEPWSGGISTAQLVQGGTTAGSWSTLNSAAYPSPFLQGVTGLYTVSYPATGQDTEVVFTNIWGAATTLDLGETAAPSPVVSLIPATTAAAFGVAMLAWLLVNGVLRTKKANYHE